MASTITLDNVVRWATTQNDLIPIVGVGGTQYEPALSICNDVMSEILQAPYAWRFNRTEATPFLTDQTAFTQDYLQDWTDLDWIENATMTDNLSTQIPTPLWPLEVVDYLRRVSQVGFPTQLAVVEESDDGLLLRLDALPNISNQYAITVVYQKKPPLKKTLQDFWNPIPDDLAYVYRQGFLAMALRHGHDPRYETEYQKFGVAIQRALAHKDMVVSDNGFYPTRGILMG